MQDNKVPVLLGTLKQRRLQRSSEAIQLLGLGVVLTPLLAMLADGAAANLVSVDQWTAFFNRASALIGTSLLLVHLVLVARVPWIETVFGLDKLTGAHKKLGKPLMYVLTLHAVTSIISLSQQNETDLVQALIALVSDYQEMLWALIGFALMIVVTVSSIRIARKYLSYEAWYLIHLVSYVAVFAAIPHQFAFGTTFLSQPWVGTYFSGLYLFVLINVAWYRSLKPLTKSLFGGFAVSRVKREGNNSVSFEVSGKGLDKLGFQSGQFFMVRVMTLRDFWKPHPFSVSNSSGEGSIRFTIGNRGDFTARIQEIKVGTRVVLEGPYGVFTEAKRSKQKVTLFAAGLGVGPIRSLSEQLATKPGDLTILYRANSARDAVLSDELAEISKARGHNLTVLTGPRDGKISWAPKQKSGPDAISDHMLLLQLAPEITQSDVYICGPSQWTNSLLVTLSKLSIPRNQIHVEEFAW